MFYMKIGKLEIIGFVVFKKNVKLLMYDGWWMMMDKN